MISKIPEDKRWLVTCEGAFSYLARDFRMQELYLWPMNADQVGSPKQVKRVIDGVKDHNILGGLLREHCQHLTGQTRWRAKPAVAMAVNCMSIP